MHSIQDLFLKGFSYVLQIDMPFICTPMWTKFYSCEKWVLHYGTKEEAPLDNPFIGEPRGGRLAKDGGRAASPCGYCPSTLSQWCGG
jgi:hypothetical protein